MFYREVIHKVAGLEIVGAVQEQAGIGEQSVDVVRSQIGHFGAYFDFRVEGGNLSGRGHGLGQGGSSVCFVEE